MRYQDRIFITGATSTGKSHLARRLFLSAPLRDAKGQPTRRMVIDPADSDLTMVPGAVTFHDPARPPEALTARFVPEDPYDVEAYDVLYRKLFNRFPCYVWVDEAGIVLPASGVSKAARTLLVQGRKREIGHLALHTRPREVDSNLIAQAAHVAVFDLPNPDDRRRIAELAGIPPRELDAHMGGLVEHGFLWWSQRDRTLTVCDPI